MRTLVLAALVVAAPLVLGACAERLEAPRDIGVCYSIGVQPDKSIKFNKVASNVKSLEYCAAELEKIRLHYLRLGGNVQETSGTYQGHFIFLTRNGIFSGDSFEGPRYLALVRYNNKLVVPGAVPQ